MDFLKASSLLQITYLLTRCSPVDFSMQIPRGRSNQAWSIGHDCEDSWGFIPSWKISDSQKHISDRKASAF